MLGMVDIASQRAGEVLFDCGWYKRTMIEVVTSAKQQLRDMYGEDGEALLFVNKLVFHFAYLPTWGNNFTPFRGNITTADVKYCSYLVFSCNVAILDQYYFPSPL